MPMVGWAGTRRHVTGTSAETPMAQLFPGGQFDIAKRQQTPRRPFVQDEGSVSFPGAITCHEQSSLFSTLGCDAFTMRSFDHCGNAHALYQRHQDRHMDREPHHEATTKMAVCGCASVCTAMFVL